MANKHAGLRGADLYPPKAETSARAQLNAVTRRGEDRAAGEHKSEATKQKRREQLSQFKEGDMVTDGLRHATIKSIDMKLALMTVSILRSHKKEQWAPDFVKKV